MNETPQLENGFTRIANELYEATMKLSIGGYDLRIVHAIIRKTYGFGKTKDRIALSQIRELTNISVSHVSESLKRLTSYLIVTKIGNSLAINKDYHGWKVPESRKGGKFPKKGIALPEIGKEKFPNPALQKKERNYTKERGTLELSKTRDYLLEIPPGDIVELMSKTSATEKQIISKGEDLHDWCQTNGKRKKDYKAFLRVAVKKDYPNKNSERPGFMDAREMKKKGLAW